MRSKPREILVYVEKVSSSIHEKFSILPSVFMATCSAARNNSFHEVLEKSFGGYNCSFVVEPEQGFYCLICARVLCEPELTDCCGNHYCSSCLKKWLENSDSCPLCREKEFVTLRDKKMERNVQGLQVKCRNHRDGCDWTGELRELTSHVANICPYTLMECTNSCGDIVQRKQFSMHLEKECFLRKVTCGYCSLEGTYELIIDEHYDVCPKVPVTCPNSCTSEPIVREYLIKHISVCPLEEIECNFAEFGCKVKMFRKDLTQHLVESQCDHLSLTLETIISLKDTVEDYEEELAETKEQMESDKVVMLEEKTKLRKEISDLREQFSRVLQTRRNSNSAIHGNANHSSHPPAASIDVHLTELARRCITEPFLPMLVKLDDFEWRKQNGECWQSNHFYTHAFGYKLCLRVYPNGWGVGQGTHISVYLHLMSGEYDDEVDWPINDEFTVELQNQASRGNHYAVECNLTRDEPPHIRKRVRGGGNTRARWGSGTPTFIPLLSLYKTTASCQYVKNDTLYFVVY